MEFNIHLHMVALFYLYYTFYLLPSPSCALVSLRTVIACPLALRLLSAAATRLHSTCDEDRHPPVSRHRHTRRLSSFRTSLSPMSAIGAGVQGAQQRNQEATVWVGGLDDQLNEGEQGRRMRTRATWQKCTQEAVCGVVSVWLLICSVACLVPAGRCRLVCPRSSRLCCRTAVRTLHQCRSSR